MNQRVLAGEFLKHNTLNLQYPQVAATKTVKIETTNDLGINHKQIFLYRYMMREIPEN